MKLLTPAGKIDYPHLNVADTKFDVEGIYKANLVLDDDDKAKAFIAQLEAIQAQAMTDAGPKARATRDLPWGLVDGQWVIKAKLKASGFSKMHGAFTQRPRLYDAHNDIWDVDNKINSGAIGRFSVDAVGYNANSGVGVTLRLKAVQVFKNGQGKSSCPFDAVPAEVTPDDNIEF